MLTMIYCKNYLFGTFSLTKNADPDKYSYSGYGISFYMWNISIVKWLVGRKVVVFAADVSSSVHVDNQKNTYLNSC